MNRHKHLLLLIALLLVLVTQPLIARATTAGALSYDLLVAAASVGVLLIVFHHRWERIVAVCMALPAVALTVVRYVDHAPTAYAALYHLSTALFIGFALVVIVRDLFQNRTIGVDAIVGAFAGYVLLGVAWGSLYAATEALAPGSFAINSEIRWQLDDWHLRRALFNYFSMATMAGLGYSDITAVKPLTNTLAWLEVMTAQFYLAVIIAQMVGLKLGATEPRPR